MSEQRYFDYEVVDHPSIERSDRLPAQTIVLVLGKKRMCVRSGAQGARNDCRFGLQQVPCTLHRFVIEM